jgi:hypothetical protein
MFPGETVLSGGRKTCYECDKTLEFRVLKSSAGHYVGTQCEHHGPHTRETNYFKTKDQAQHALEIYKEIGVLPQMRK